MEQNVDAGVPVTPMVENKQKNGNGLKITTAIACIVAICGIGLSIYGFVDSNNKSQEISNLKAQIEEQNSVIANLKNASSQNNNEDSDIAIAAKELCEKNNGNFSSESNSSSPNINSYYTCATRQNLKFAVTVFDTSFINDEAANETFKKMQEIGEGNKADNLTVLEIKPNFFKGYESTMDGYTFFAGFNNISIELFTMSIAAGNNYLFDLGYPLEY